MTDGALFQADERPAPLDGAHPLWMPPVQVRGTHREAWFPPGVERIEYRPRRWVMVDGRVMRASEMAQAA